MKVMDLYIKYSNGEDLPEKIEIGNNVFELNETGDIYYTGAYNNIPLSMEWDLNDEVKIIEEEEKEIKMCNVLEHCIDFSENENILLDNQLRLQDKINELIEAVNEIRKEK